MSVGFGKWFARIGHDSVRELPYTTRVNGNETEIVAYCYDATGVTMPTVGTDWYPVVIDSYTTAEYADLDAYLASEYGSELLPGCGCSAVVPLETAVARLSDNDINITVHDDNLLYNAVQQAAVNKLGQMLLKQVNGQYLRVVDVEGAQHAEWLDVGETQESYLDQHGACYAESFTDKTVTYDGRTYNWDNVDSEIDPQLSTYSE